MPYSKPAVRLRIPEIKQLGRVSDRVSFLFLDRCRVEQTRTGVEAWHEEDGELWKTTIPASNLAVLALGPGVGISTPALTTLHRSGTTVIITNAEGFGAYYVGRSLTSSSRWAAAQARIWADTELRKAAAIRLYAARFADEQPAQGLPLAVLRGMEGQRVKHAYARHASMNKVRGFKRDSKATDTVNQSLNLGNSILYGVAATVCAALGLNPALGFIHEGNYRAMLFDLADVYKPTVSIPAAFASEDVDAAARRIRREIHSRRILSEMLGLTQHVLTPGIDPSAADSDSLLADEGWVPGHTNWDGT